MQSGELRSMMVTPCSRSQSRPPGKLTDSPTTTVPMPNWRTRPLQYQQGASVVDHDRVAIGAPSPGVAEGGGLGVERGVAVLDAAVVAATEEVAVEVEEGGTDRDAALGEAMTGFGEGDCQHGGVVGLCAHGGSPAGGSSTWRTALPM